MLPHSATMPNDVAGGGIQPSVLSRSPRARASSCVDVLPMAISRRKKKSAPSALESSGWVR
jgi:hypothetical protein